MAAPSFDLVDVLRTIQKRKIFILGIIIFSMLLGGAFTLIKKKKYKAEARVLVNNPVYTDRNNLFRFRDSRFMEYFGGDDELDRVTAIANSDTFANSVIWKADFKVIYNGNIDDPSGHAWLMSIFRKNFNLKRSEYKDLQLTYTAYDPQAAANVVNTSVKVLADAYRNCYSSVMDNITATIQDKIKQVNVSIDSLTDSLAAMRDRYGVYDIISPARENVIIGDIKGGGKGFGNAIEQIQNLEAIKDQLVSDRAHYISIINEFAASANSTMGYMEVITRATPPLQPTGPGLLITVLVAGCLGLFFSIVYVLMMAYFHKLNAVVR